LAAHRDQSISYEPDAAIARLEPLRQVLQDLGSLSEAWDVLSAQLDLARVGYREQYMEHEASFSTTTYLNKAASALPLLDAFLESEHFRTPANRTIGWAQAALLKAEVLHDQGDELGTIRQILLAEEYFRQNSAVTGYFDVEIFMLEAWKEMWSYSYRLHKLNRKLRQRNDVQRLRRLRKVRYVSSNGDPNSNMDWAFRQRAEQGELAYEAGDYISSHRWKLRRYAADTMASLLISDSEKVLCSTGGVQSALLANIATFNLSKAFLVQGNFLDAAACSILHFNLVDDQTDTERGQRAVLLILEIFVAAFASFPPEAQKEAIKEIAAIWNGWLDGVSPQRWQEGNPRCDEIERFIESACFLPSLAGMMKTETLGKCSYITDDVAQALLRHLEVAFNLFRCLPTYASSMIVPRLSRALGSAAVYAGNKELACRSYVEGLYLCHSGDVWNKMVLQMESGRLLTSLATEDPEHWLPVVWAGRSLLRAARHDFFKNRDLQYAVQHGVRCSICLLKSYVAEARGLKRYMDNGGAKKDHLRGDSSDFDPVEVCNKLTKVRSEADFEFLFALELLYDSKQPQSKISR
jgi:hypothetical protein